MQSDSDITVLRHLEKLGCRLVNRPQSILNCINKFWTFQELAGHGVPMPDTFSYGECPWNRVEAYLSRSAASLLCFLSPQALKYLDGFWYGAVHLRGFSILSLNHGHSLCLKCLCFFLSVINSLNMYLVHTCANHHFRHWAKAVSKSPALRAFLPHQRQKRASKQASSVQCSKCHKS